MEWVERANNVQQKKCFNIVKSCGNAGVAYGKTHFILIHTVRYEAIIFTQTIKLQKEAENRCRRKIIILSKLK